EAARKAAHSRLNIAIYGCSLTSQSPQESNVALGFATKQLRYWFFNEPLAPVEQLAYVGWTRLVSSRCTAGIKVDDSRIALLTLDLTSPRTQRKHS
ncbi:MAG: hypothetical protein KTR25_04290, partial [Myxococcales bacterium]|nr:hypothetical protein [Myxococcales bacterium]